MSFIRRLSEMTEKIITVRDLMVYRRAFELAMEIFKLTAVFPKEGKYSLTDQIRRSSRSICSNLSEAWRKRKHPKAFISKLSDSMQEAAETQTWLEFSYSAGTWRKANLYGLTANTRR